VEAENVEDFILLLGETAYFKGKDATVQLGDEITYRKVMDKTYDRICRKYPASIAPVLRYLYDKENEIDTLTTILEGIRYQTPSREIRQLVIVTG
jgi:V/A-type H+-transporting ATPase subunit C